MEDGDDIESGWWSFGGGVWVACGLILSTRCLSTRWCLSTRLCGVIVCFYAVVFVDAVFSSGVCAENVMRYWALVQVDCTEDLFCVLNFLIRTILDLDYKLERVLSWILNAHGSLL